MSFDILAAWNHLTGTKGNSAHDWAEQELFLRFLRNQIDYRSTKHKRYVLVMHQSVASGIPEYGHTGLEIKCSFPGWEFNKLMDPRTQTFPNMTHLPFNDHCPCDGFWWTSRTFWHDGP